MTKKEMRRLSNKLLLPLALLAWVLVVVRASRLAITQQEAFTFMHYVQASYLDILLLRDVPPLISNHLLNSLLAKLSTALFGLSTFSLRLPNALLAGLYFFYAALLAKKFTHPLSTVAAFLILVLQPYFFDYFSLAQGYGMGLALLLAAIYHLSEYHEQGKGHHTYRTLLFAALAGWAHFSFIYAYLGLVALLLLLAYADGFEARAWWQLIRALLLVSTGLALASVPALRQVYADFPGGYQGFWVDSVDSLILKLSYQGSAWVQLIWRLSFGLFFGLGLLAALYDLYIKPQQRVHSFYQILLLWLLLILLVSSVAHYALDLPWLEGPMGLVYVPVFMGVLLFLARRLIVPNRFNWFPKIILSILALALGVHLANRLNLRRTMDWPQDADGRRVWEKLEYEVAGGGNARVKVFASPYYRPYFHFMRRKEEAQWLQPVQPQALQTADYALLHPARDTAWRQKVRDRSFVRVDSFALSGVELYRRR